MDIHPNNTLAQYITNLPRRISLYGEWECGLTEIHYPHDWYNVRNARMVVEHEESVHNVYLDDGYYDHRGIRHTSMITTAPKHSSKHSIATNRAG